MSKYLIDYETECGYFPEKHRIIVEAETYEKAVNSVFCMYPEKDIQVIVTGVMRP